MAPQPQTPLADDRHHTIVTLLNSILQRLDAIERHVDQIDRNTRPFGDGTTTTGRRRA